MTPPNLLENFNVNQLFTYAQVIIDALLPAVYILVGFALGFLVIRALRGAFS